MDLTPLILHRDANILVLNKPTGMPVHKGRGPFTPLEAYFPQLQFDLPSPPQLAHRLDKDTSGCLVLGRRPEAMRILGKLFTDNKIKKTYLAVVTGTLPALEGSIDLPLAPKSKRRDLWQMQVDLIEGKESKTLYKLLKNIILPQGDPGALVELTPITGRTHQLRVHLAALGSAIYGDPIYGHPATTPLCLHAARICLPYYRNEPDLVVEAPLPAHMLALL